MQWILLLFWSLNGQPVANHIGYESREVCEQRLLAMQVRTRQTHAIVFVAALDACASWCGKFARVLSGPLLFLFMLGDVLRTVLLLGAGLVVSILSRARHPAVASAA